MQNLLYCKTSTFRDFVKQYQKLRSTSFSLLLAYEKEVSFLVSSSFPLEPHKSGKFSSKTSQKPTTNMAESSAAESALEDSYEGEDLSGMASDKHEELILKSVIEPGERRE